MTKSQIKFTKNKRFGNIKVTLEKHNYCGAGKQLSH